MAKALVVISTLVNPTIAEEHRDMNFVFFRTLEEMGAYIECSPLQADELILTRDVLPYVNESLNYLATLLENPFLSIEHVKYVTETNSPEAQSVRYLCKVKQYDNWEVIEGSLTRTFIASVIAGTVELSDTSGIRKVVYRVPRRAYVKDKMRNSDKLQEHYENDSEYLKDIPAVETPEPVLVRREIICTRYNIVGLDCGERTAFAYLVAQYLSHTGKVIILERDTEYHRLSDFVLKSSVKRLDMYIEDLYANPSKFIDTLQRTPAQLICVIAKKRVKYDYSFIASLLYNNLMHYASYFVYEVDLSEIPIDEDYVLVTPARVPDILHMCELIDPTYACNAALVGVTDDVFQETQLVNSEQLRILVSDVLHTEIDTAVLFKMRTLSLYGSLDYDLGAVLRKRDAQADVSAFVQRRVN